MKKKSKNKWEVHIGPPMPPYLKPPFSLVNLPKGPSLGGLKDCSKLSNGDRDLNSSHHQPPFFFFFFPSSSSFFSFFLHLFLLFMFFYFFYFCSLPPTTTTMKITNVARRSSPHLFLLPSSNHSCTASIDDD